jgi:hypothetical protein
MLGRRTFDKYKKGQRRHEKLAKGKPHYSIDTSSLIRWYVEHYSPDVFEGLPSRLSALIEEGRLRAIRHIRDGEIRDSEDDETLAKWCKAQEKLYVDESEEIQEKVKELLAQYQNPKRKKGISGADPFVIALACVNGGQWFVVSEELPHLGNEQSNPNIPYVCNGEGIEHINFLDMLRKEGWRLK